MARRFVLFLVLGAMSSGLAAGARAADGGIDIRKVHRIVTIGGKNTQEGSRPGGYVWQIGEYIRVLYPHRKIEVINAGRAGDRSRDMLARYQHDVLDQKPDLVTISAGLNDVWLGFSPEHPAGYGPFRVPLPEFRSNVEAMIKAAHKAGAKVVLFTTTVFEDQPESLGNLRLRAYDDAIRELAAHYHTGLADDFADFMTAWRKDPSIHLTTDHIHLAPAGDDLMAHTALLAFGIPAKALDRARPEVMKRR